MWKKIVAKLPLSFPPIVGSIHWMRPAPEPFKKRKFGAARSATWMCNISRSEYRFYDREVEPVTDAELLAAYGVTHNLMPQNKDTFATINEFRDPEGVAQVVYKARLEEGDSITDALASAFGLYDGTEPDADPNFDKLFYFCPKEADPNELT